MTWWLKPGISETMIMESGAIGDDKVNGISVEVGRYGRVGEKY